MKTALVLLLVVLVFPASVLADTWGEPIPVDRFVILDSFNGQAVFDRETALIWELVVSTTRRTRREAGTVCHDKVVGGRKGWRLPAIEELGSLVEPTAANPALPVGHPFVGVTFSIPIFQVRYWSSSSFPQEGVVPVIPPFPATVDTEVLDFRFGEVRLGNSTQSLLSWCVRGGRGHNGR